MRTLAIDTTANTASCAIAEDGRVKAFFTVDGLLTHSETMLPMIDEILKKSALSINDIDVFAVANGPGSFTGVRIGVSTVKGLTFSSGKPCVEVSSLAALAENLNGFDGLCVPVMDARRGQVYTAIYNNEGKCILGDSLIPLGELCDELAKYNEPIRLCGDGYDLAKKFISADNRLSERLIETSPLLILHNAASVALLAEKSYASGKYSSDDQIRPLYLRDSQAERERKEKLTNNLQGV